MSHEPCHANPSQSNLQGFGFICVVYHTCKFQFYFHVSYLIPIILSHGAWCIIFFLSYRISAFVMLVLSALSINRTIHTVKP